MTAIRVDVEPPEYKDITVSSGLVITTPEKAWLETVLKVYDEGGPGFGNLGERFSHIGEYLDLIRSAELLHLRIHGQILTPAQESEVNTTLTAEETERIIVSHNQQPSHQARMVLTATGIIPGF